MKTFSALPVICVENSPVIGEFPLKKPVTLSFDVSFDLRPNTRLSKQWRRRSFETPSRSVWRHCNGFVSVILQTLPIVASSLPSFHIVHYSFVTWAWWCLKSLAIRLFVQNFVQNNNKGTRLSVQKLVQCNSKGTSKFHITGLWEGNPTVTGGFPSQRISNAETVFMSWRHNETGCSIKSDFHIPW